ncbi:MAG: G5 domain-containing protein [Candidatus Saccharibacteria bacterium]|nr:G5 domain-containing protein [Candidatus Saccharibacteria bacterium]
MRLSRNIDKLLLIVTIFVLSFVFAFMFSRNNNDTFAESENQVYMESEDHFVTFYDDGEKLIVKTDAGTVEEAIKRAGIILNVTDIVEPGLSEKIEGDDFFINIHRSRPVVVRDGKSIKYIMTASYDKMTIAKEAGLTIYDGDEIKLVQNTNFLEFGAASVYEITRNGGRNLTVKEEIPFGEETVKDYNLAPGAREVRQLGEIGEKELVYEVFYVDGEEVSRKLISETVVREPVVRIVAVGASEIERKPLTAAMGRNRYTIRRDDGSVIERQETYYDLDMSGVMSLFSGQCGSENYYTVREDGAKVDSAGYVLVAADLSRYPRCSVVETSLGLGKVYDTGSFALTNPEQFDLATDWTNRNGR